MTSTIVKVRHALPKQTRSKYIPHVFTLTPKKKFKKKNMFYRWLHAIVPLESLM